MDSQDMKKSLLFQQFPQLLKQRSSSFKIMSRGTPKNIN
uniref:Uncharacterized protein n=1 Tax=Lepeophtheirus salmonis TaxID=72036 RepID=A0A0K2VAV5_LEPSM